MIALRLKEQSGNGQRCCCSVTDGAIRQPGRLAAAVIPTRELSEFVRLRLAFSLLSARTARRLLGIITVCLEAGR
jgi:hypothetical protein